MEAARQALGAEAFAAAWAAGRQLTVDEATVQALAISELRPAWRVRHEAGPSG